MAQKFEELKICQNVRAICQKIFLLIREEPFKRDFDLVPQIRRSSGSCMDNIAEGHERGGNKEFIQYLYFGKGSIGETRSQLYRAFDFEYIDNKKFNETRTRCENQSRMLSGMINHLKTSNYRGEKFH